MAIAERELNVARPRRIDDIADKVFDGERLTAEDGCACSRTTTCRNLPSLPTTSAKNCTRTPIAS